MWTLKAILTFLLLCKVVIDSRKFDEINLIRSYLGCFKIFGGKPSCRENGISNVHNCLMCCFEKNSTYSALSGNGTCYCGESFEWSAVDLNCDSVCSTSKKESCGIYKVFSVCEIGYHGMDCQIPCSSCSSSVPCSRLKGQCLGDCRKKLTSNTCDLRRLMTDVNIAMKQPVNQSSMYTNKENISYPAENAVDGNFSNTFPNGSSCSHTENDDFPWFYVELFKSIVVKTVVITSRTPKHGSRLNEAVTAVIEKLSGLNKTILSELQKKPKSQEYCYQHNDISDKDLNITFNCSKAIKGKFVLVFIPRQEYLTICELEVYIPDCGNDSDCFKHEVCGSFTLEKDERKRCQCQQGYSRQHLTSSCQDIDECKENGSLCGVNEYCKNLKGTYECLCSPGYRNETKTGCVPVPPTTSTVVILVVVIVVLTVIVVAILAYRFLRIRKASDIDDAEKMALSEPKNEKFVKEEAADRETRILIVNLADYITDVMKTNSSGFADQFDKIPKTENHSMAVGKSHKGREKNRFSNIVPYDYNRVILQKSSEGDSDYINASHIETKYNNRKIIAAQGPTEESVAQFWQMVLEQDVSDIIMLTKTEEKNKNKCFQYWPDEDQTTFGGYSVSLEATVDFEDYVRRELKATKENSVGVPVTVTQWQYMSWPDHGVPSCVESFLRFLEVSMRHERPTGTIVVHCSAGVGRTGCFLAIDMLLDEASGQRSVDVVACVRALRDQRPSMVQTALQYDFIYYTLKGSATKSKTTISTLDFHSKYFSLNDGNKLEQEFQMLKEEATFLAKQGQIKCMSCGWWTSSYMGLTASNHHHVGSLPGFEAIEEFWKFCSQIKFLVIVDNSENWSRHKFLPTVGNNLLVGDWCVVLKRHESTNFGAELEIALKPRKHQECFYVNKTDLFEKEISCQILHVNSNADDDDDDKEDGCTLSWNLFQKAKKRADRLLEDKQFKNMVAISGSESSLASCFIAYCDLLEQMNDDFVDISKAVLELMRTPASKTITSEFYLKLYKIIDGHLGTSTYYNI